MDWLDIVLAWAGANIGLVISGIIVSSVIFGFVVMMTALDSNV
jgi:hypothetical protein